MANRAFEIQESKLRIGGVDLEAGTTAVVIPGVTQATSYRVEEVEDTDVEQTHSFTTIPTVIDPLQFAILNGDDVGAGTNTPATYEVEELDDDGYIDEIDVTSQGSFVAPIWIESVAYMYATEVANAIANFNAGDWVQIPFQPKVRADEVETIGGGSGVVAERSISFPYGEEGDTRGTIALTPDGKTYVCVADWEETTQPEEFSALVETTRDHDSIGDERNGIYINIGDYPDLGIIRNSNIGQLSGQWQVNGYSCTNVYDFDEGVLALEWPFSFGSTPNRIQIGDEFTVSFSTNPLPGPEIWRQLDAGALFNSNDQTGYDDVILSVFNRDIEIRAVRNDNDTSADVSLIADDDIHIEADDHLNIISSKNVKISTNGNQGEEYFSFTQSGTLRFPDGTSQQTAYQGRQFRNIPAYKGFEASYARIYENEDADDEYAVSKLVIYKAETAPMARADISGADRTDDDYFRVNGLGGTDIVAMFVLYRNDWQAEPTNNLRSVAEYAIDNIILNGGVEGQINTVTDMKSAFYSNYSTFNSYVSLDAAFEFYNNSWSYLTNTSTRTGPGSGLAVDIEVFNGNYVDIVITSAGSNYIEGQGFKILGGSLGGADGVNDFTFYVNVDGSGGATGISGSSGTAAGADATYSALNPTLLGGQSAQIFVNAYDHTDDVVNNLKEVGLSNTGTGYRVGDVLTVLGTAFAGGATPDNDVTFTVTAVNSETSNSITSIEYTSGTIPPRWPEYNIDDGGRDQYDNANFIYTNILGDSSVEGGEDDYTALPYNNGNVIAPGSIPHFGANGTGVVVYKSGIFGLFARDVEIEWIGTNGNSGADGESSIDCGSLYRTESAMFRTDGSIELPYMFNTAYEATYDLNGPTLKLGTTGQQTIITGPAATGNSTDADRLIIQGQKGWGGENEGKGEGGDVYIWAGTGGDGGSVDPQGDGGDVKLRGGEGGNNGGYIRIESGNATSDTGTGGFVDINAGNASEIQGNGGDVNIRAGSGGLNNGEVNIYTVNETKHWTFKNDGSLQLPVGGDIVNSDGNSILDGAGGDLIGNGFIEGDGYQLTYYVDFTNSSSGGASSLTGVLLPSSDTIQIGDIIAFRTGETRTIATITVGPDGGLDSGSTLYEWSSGGTVESSITDPAFPITISSSDYTENTKPTARIKPNADYVSLGQYMEIYTGGAPSTMDDLGHIHMKGHTGNVELFLGTDNNFVSTKEAGTTPGHVTMRSETDVKVIETDIRTRRNGSTFINDLGDGYNYHWVHGGQSGDIAHNTVAVDSQGNYYVGGEHTSYAEGMVSKFSKDGSLLWSKLIGGESQNYAYDVPVVAVNPTNDRVTVLYFTDFVRGNDYFKMAELDADGNIDGTVTDFYDVDGNVRPRDMKWHPSLGWVIVGRTNGDELASASLSPQTGSGVGRLVLDAAATDLKGSLMNYGDASWYLGGTNISGKQLLDTGIGLFRSVSVVNVTVANPAAAGAAINVRINYAGSAYYGIDGIATPGSNYTTGDTVKVLGTDLGGASPANDVEFIIVDNGTGGIAGSTGASGTPVLSTISLDMAQLGFTTEDFSTGSYIVYKQVNGRPFVWTSTWKKFLDVEEGYDYGYATSVEVVDSDIGAIYVTGYTEGSRNSAGGGGFLWKLTHEGVTSWIKGNDLPVAISEVVVDSSGNIYTITNFMGTDITQWLSDGTAVRRIVTDGPFGGYGHIDIATDETGNESLYVVWGSYASPFAPGNGMAVQKFNLALEQVWSRHMYLANEVSLYVNYEDDYRHFALTPTQAVVVGYGDTLNNGSDDGQLWSMSITDDFEPTGQVGDVNGIVTEIVDLAWASWGPYTAENLTEVLLPRTSSLTTESDTDQFVWNTMTWQNRILNGNFETKGLADIEKINFVQGGDLGHNPADVPLSTQNLQEDDSLNWNITLRMSDRGKFIKNMAAPTYGNVQDLTVYVPKSSDVPFPIGTVITLINLDTSGTYNIYVHGVGWNEGDSDRPIIWAAGETVESGWGFGGLQTATLMKIGNNDWLLTANNIFNND